MLAEQKKRMEAFPRYRRRRDTAYVSSRASRLRYKPESRRAAGFKPNRKAQRRCRDRRRPDAGSVATTASPAQCQEGEVSANFALTGFSDVLKVKLYYIGVSCSGVFRL